MGIKWQQLSRMMHSDILGLNNKADGYLMGESSHQIALHAGRLKSLDTSFTSNNP